MSDTTPDPQFETPVTPDQINNMSDATLDALGDRLADAVSMLPDAEDSVQIDLHDSEVAAAAKIQAHLHEKYSHRTATYENLKSMADEAEELFRQAGMRIQVDWVRSSLTLSAKGAPEPPLITIVGRYGDFDPEKHRYEVQRGVADKLYVKRTRK